MNIKKIKLYVYIFKKKKKKIKEKEREDLKNNKNEPQHDKTNKMTCAPSEDSDQPGHRQA